MKKLFVCLVLLLGVFANAGPKEVLTKVRTGTVIKHQVHLYPVDTYLIKMSGTSIEIWDNIVVVGDDKDVYNKKVDVFKSNNGKYYIRVATDQQGKLQ